VIASLPALDENNHSRITREQDMRFLPVGAAFSHSVNSTINNLKFAFHVSWPWMVVLLPINILTQIYLLSHPIVPGQMPELNTILVFLAIVLSSMLVFASIAVSWHRYILLDEVPQGLARLRMDGPVLRYFGNSILIVICSFLVAFAAMIPLGMIAAGLSLVSKGLGFAMAILFYIVCVLWLMGIAARWSIKLVSVALGRRDFGMSMAWAATRENQMRIIGLYVLFFLVAFLLALVFGGLTFFMLQNANVLALCVGMAVQMVFKWITTIWGVTLLTSLYGFFVENREF
jgi:hypothetical protein